MRKCLSHYGNTKNYHLIIPLLRVMRCSVFMTFLCRREAAEWMVDMTNLRIGHGYDVHRLTQGRRLILGGADIPYERGLDGHSDADVLTHAVMDALLGAAGLADIGCLFPDNDASFLNISSLKLLEAVAEKLAENRWQIVNIDATLIAQAPKIAPYRMQMRQNLADTLGVSVEQVGIKATTEEHLGFTGAGLGMAAHAVALLEKI